MCLRSSGPHYQVNGKASRLVGESWSCNYLCLIKKRQITVKEAKASFFLKYGQYRASSWSRHPSKTERYLDIVPQGR